LLRLREWLDYLWADTPRLVGVRTWAAAYAKIVAVRQVWQAYGRLGFTLAELAAGSIVRIRLDGG